MNGKAGDVELQKAISDRHRLEERLSQVVESAPTGIVIANETGKIVFVNVQAERLFGYSREELIGQDVEVLVPERFRGKHPHHRDGFVAHPTARPMGAGRDLYGLRKDGREVPVEIGLSPIVTQEGILVLSSIIDITERKRLEEMKENFLRTVSHELRTPLSILKMGVDNIEAGHVLNLTEEEREMLDIMKRNTVRLERLINDLLDLSRLESGGMKIHLRPVRIVSLLDEVLRSLEILARERGIILKKDCGTEAPVIRADADLIVRVLTNLLQNAVRFAKSEVMVSVKTLAGHIQVSVMDDGVGIGAEHLPSLFNKFVQINRPIGGSGYKGTGLGLAICKEIIQLHEGKIWAESTVGQGSQFHFTLPLKR